MTRSFASEFMAKTEAQRTRKANKRRKEARMEMLVEWMPNGTKGLVKEFCNDLRGGKSPSEYCNDVLGDKD